MLLQKIPKKIRKKENMKDMQKKKKKMVNINKN